MENQSFRRTALHRLYEAPAYDTSTWPDSHWRKGAEAPRCAPLVGEARTDFAIVGAGVTGLNAALELVEASGAEVAVLDAAQPGWAASGRNGGFVSLGGSKLSDAALVRRFGREGAEAFRAFQKDAIARVARNLDSYSIAADRGPEGEVYLAHREREWQAMRESAEGLRAMHGPGARLLPREELKQAGFGPAGFAGGFYTPLGFPVHPLKYTAGLARAALDRGIRIFGDSPVTALEPEADGWRLSTPKGSLRARRVLIATNGYTSDDLPPWIGGRTLPALSSIHVTRPLTEAERRAQGWTSQVMAADTRHLLHYFRLLPDNRFLFGMRGGLSVSPGPLARIRAEGRRHLEAMFPEWAHVETESFWSGLVCLTGSLTPFAGEVPGSPGLFAAFGWHGSGMATGTLAGRMVARAMTGASNPAPLVLRSPPKRFPLPNLRRAWLGAAYAWYKTADGPVRAQR
ncbi:FAD-dependent oxidoreductase [Ostreiculturibacter nitratireducens]|uniref:NAD(P)/FAD-dependent oxidoreductase n=1 Tax=Ostreiculturibacter nitratireducens TaxID=3075226 RepID=UPI0031B64F0B